MMQSTQPGKTSISRRDFYRWLAAGTGVLAEASRDLHTGPSGSQAATVSQTATGSHVGSLYPFIQQQAARSPLELSFLRSQFKDLKQWQRRARAKVLQHLFYQPPPVAPKPQLIRRTDRGDYFEEYLTFQTTPDLRVPAFVLIPKKAKLPAPGIVALHCHGGFYLWGKEKIVEGDNEHPALIAFKQELYGGKSIASELVRQGYVVITIDMFYWGERRMILDDDPPAYRDRPRNMSADAVRAFNRRSSENEPLVARSLFTAGITWPGIILWDDMRTVDYLASRPEVDSKRLGCVGLSVGGYRSFLLAALDPRIKAAVDDGWMTSFASQIKNQVIHSVGFSFHLIGLYRYLDLPDLAALIAPRAVMIINGSRDSLFAADGVKAAFEKIARCYAKAAVPERQRCRLYDAPHEFNLQMQADAWEWLRRWV
ncbi:MAG TPA: alpha/beta hydrolase family protein [Acidobacteriota bacterium]|jgi:dienelactone hydrolase